ncbi:MAG: type I-Fv CRISPR-associated protein Cas5fv [Desulfuromonadaceae bacterium]|nr:type I-Fv CRISPR-associated protein Cas5fv [Desulfuromonadaceae bacterium]
MRIMIEYESTWRNSFLDGNNNEPLPKHGRKFIASISELKKKGNYVSRKITQDTVMGVINRLIGDQRKLYQSRKDDNYFFRELESAIDFNDRPLLTNEVTYIRNISGSTDQNAFTGMIKTNDIIFNSGYSKEFWGVLALDIDELCAFIIEKGKVEKVIELDPLSACARFAELAKLKPVANEGDVQSALTELDRYFPGTNYLTNKGEVVPSTIYCSSLYLQLNRLSKRHDMSSALTRSGTIPGVSKRIFTKKDFMDRFTTGAKKKIWGNPYMRKERIKGEGEVVSLMTKASGTLEITIDVDRDRAKEIKLLIENAGVSSFYLGKKGLAYVTDIDTRAVKR